MYKKLAIQSLKKKSTGKEFIFFGAMNGLFLLHDDRNNAKMAYNLLIDHIDIPAAQVHVMRTDIEPVFAAKEYEKNASHLF